MGPDRWLPGNEGWQGAAAGAAFGLGIDAACLAVGAIGLLFKEARR